MLAALAALALPFVGCAAPPIVPGEPKEVRAHPLPPYQIHEECLSMKEGDELRWRFSASAPLSFDIHYHEGKAVIMPVTLDRVTAESGTFVALVDQDYCLMWEAGPKGTPVDYRIELRRRKAR